MICIKKTPFIEYEIVSGTANDCLNDIYNSLCVISGPRWLACLNPHSYVIAKKDHFFQQALQNADWLVPDGVGVVWASHLLGYPVVERITGSDIFWGLLKRFNKEEHLSVFFLGSTQEVLNKIQLQMKIDYPNVHIAGAFSPPYKHEFNNTDIEEMLHAININKPDILWVGMTAPKQEKWIFQNKHRLEVKFIAAIGAVFDFYSGEVKRSHPFFQKVGLEWLPRFLKEPRRLWRRVFVSAPLFLLYITRRRCSRSGRL